MIKYFIIIMICLTSFSCGLALTSHGATQDILTTQAPISRSSSPINTQELDKIAQEFVSADIKTKKLNQNLISGNNNPEMKIVPNANLHGKREDKTNPEKPIFFNKRPDIINSMAVQTMNDKSTNFKNMELVTEKEQIVEQTIKQKPETKIKNSKLKKKDLTPTISKILAADQFDLKIAVYSTNEGAKIRIISTEPMIYKTMQLTNPASTIISLEGIMRTQLEQIPHNQILDSLSINKYNNKTHVILKFKKKPDTIKYNNFNYNALDINIR